MVFPLFPGAVPGAAPDSRILPRKRVRAADPLVQDDAHPGSAQDATPDLR